MQLARPCLLGIVAFSLTTNIQTSYAQLTDTQGQALAGAQLKTSVNGLSRWLRGSRAEAGWRKYLNLAALENLVGNPNTPPDRGGIRDILAKFESGQPGLEMPQFVAVRKALTEWLATAPAAPDDLPTLLREAKGKYVPPTTAAVTAARGRVVDAHGQLKRFLGQQRAYSSGWSQYLRLQDLETELAAGKEPDLEKLTAVHTQLASGAVGLELPQFAELTAELNNYLNQARLLANPQAAEDYDQQLETLAGTIEAHQRTPDETALLALGPALDWLERGGQQGVLVRQVKRIYSRPNFLLEVSEKIAAQGLARRVDEVAPVRDMILGTSIRGTGRTVGNVSVEFQPNNEQAVMDLRLLGVNYSRTTGSNGPALIYTRSTTQLEAIRRVLLNAEGILIYPVRASADADSHITGFGSTKRGLVDKIVKKAAAKRAPGQQGASERIAGQHAAERLAVQFGNETNTALYNANRKYKDNFLTPLKREGQFPEDFRFSTTRDALRLVARQASGAQIAAPLAAPALEGKPAIGLRMHQSAVNNMGDEIFAGKRFDQVALEKSAQDLLGRVPEQLKERDEEGQAWSITFADKDPVTLTIDDGQLALSIRGQRFTSGDKSYEAMDITVRYALERQGKGLKLTRQGDLEIYPPGYVPGQGNRLSSRQTVIRNRLQKRLADVFKQEIVSEGLKFEGELAKLGTLPVRQLSADAGWLTLAWE